MGSEKQADVNDLEVLTTLVDDYEERVHPISPPDPIEAIRFRMEQAGLTPRDLIPILGSRSKASEVLSGKRTLMQMARALHEHLGISAESLLARPTAASSHPVVDWERFPIPAMPKLGWLPQVRSWRARAESLMSELISAAGGPAMLPETLYKKQTTLDKTPRPTYTV
jgi:HTH-type transcriptional regulator/antitoxin HigA